MADDPTEPQTNLANAPVQAIRFTSTPMVFVPGFIAFMRKVDRLKPDETAKACALFAFARMYPNAPAWALMALVEGRYVVEGDAVIVSPEEATTEAERAAGGEA